MNSYTIAQALGNLLSLGIVIWAVIDQRRERRNTRVYRAVFRQLIAADEPCAVPGCQVTHLGHLLRKCTESAVDVVKPTTRCSCRT